MTAGLMDRAALIRRGKFLEIFTIFYNSLEAIIALIAGFLAGSIALVGFGFDSIIEVGSGVALLWRLHADTDAERREHAERVSLRIVGLCFLGLAGYVAVESAESLVRGEAPDRSLPGIALAAVSVVVMPLLARAKRKVAAGIASGALRAEARQTEFCMYLSAILLGGLGLHALFGLWWTDPVAALVMVPIIAREGITALRGEGCACPH